MKPIPPMIFDESELGCKSHFLDSGSFTHWAKSEQWAKDNGTDRWGYFETEEFWTYVDNYAAFVKRYIKAIDHYSNVDVIPNPKLSLKVQQYLERTHDLKPVPVFHYPCDLKWLKKYIDLGYDYIGIGGLVGHHSQSVCREWIDKVFEFICSQARDGMPCIKTHGFGMTSYELLLRYPWWSTDSAYWTKQGAFGRILVPHRRNGQFIYDEQPYSIAVSLDSPEIKIKGRHYFNISESERKVVHSWLEKVQVPLGKNDEAGNVIELGVINRHCERKANNLFFFEHLLKSLPEYPWAFIAPRRASSALFSMRPS